LSKRRMLLLLGLATYSFPGAPGTGVGEGEPVGVGVGVPPPPMVLRGEITQPAVNAARHSSTASRKAFAGCRSRDRLARSILVIDPSMDCTRTKIASIVPCLLHRKRQVLTVSEAARSRRYGERVRSGRRSVNRRRWWGRGTAASAATGGQRHGCE
jgi:hypothetical protein